MAKNRKPFSWYCDELTRRMDPMTRVGEAAVACALTAEPVTRPTDERLVQCIWFDSLFLHEGLRTDSGKPLEILQPGRWNEDEGPDFQGARIRIGGEILRGDVEIHIDSSGWRQHRHHLNPVYDGVVLHAYLTCDGTERSARNSRGDMIDGFHMEPVLFPDLETIRQTVQVEDYPYQTPSATGRCQPLMCSLDVAFVADLLESAGRERIETKAARFTDQSLGETLEQVLYQALMTSMGHKANKGLFFLLSKRVPLAELADYLRDVGRGRAVDLFQALLLYVARLVPDLPDDADTETADYVSRIEPLWDQFEGYFSDRLIPPTQQWITGVRPVNFAHRRLGGVARVIDRLFLEEGMLNRFLERVERFDADAKPAARKRWIRSELVEPFVVDTPDDFWAHRYTFTSRRAGRPMKLIGESRAESVVFNALLPILLIKARDRRAPQLEGRIWDIAEAFPPLQSNAIVRHMRTRLFGDDQRADEVLTTEIRQQGLFQIFASCCNHNELGCEDCYYQRVHL